MLIRSITQNAMDTKFSIRQFPSPEHPYIAFPQKNLAVLDISRFTFCKVDYKGETGDGQGIPNISAWNGNLEDE